MNDEIKALREEVARLRERVAVLEARPQTALPQPIYPPPQVALYWQPGWWQVTCNAASSA